MAEKKKQTLEPGTEEFDAKHAELREAVKKAQQELWDHVHPVIEDPQVKAQQEWKSQQAAERKASTGPVPVHPGGSPEDVKRQSERTKRK